MNGIMWEVFFNWVVPGGITAMFVALVVGLILAAPWWPWMK